MNINNTTTMNNNVSNLKKFQKLNCSPKPHNQNLEFSCFTSTMLYELQEKWNIRHPDKRINFDDPYSIWGYFKTTFGEICENEVCWLQQEFAKSSLGKTFLHSFAPEQPNSWNSNPNEWLSNVDIHKAMKQYEMAHNDFLFIGPSPIDFNNVSNGKCVWEDLCKFSLENMLLRNKKKIGIIFNLDNHNEPGSHWVSLYIDIYDRSIYYFDSTRVKVNEVPVEIQRFVNKIMLECKERYDEILDFHVSDKIIHQTKNSECGVYCLYFIISLLTGEKKWKDFLKTRISDEEIMKYRNIYFNKPIAKL